MSKGKNSNPFYIQVMIAFVCFALASVVLWSINHSWWSLPLIPVMLLGIHYRQKLAVNWQRGMLALMLVMLSVLCFKSAWIMYSNIAQPPEWDFLVFWLDGRIAAQGLNFYEPEHFQKLANPLDPSEDFTREILEVGFWYPPPTMFLFVFLGWFNIQTAYLLWCIVNGVVLVVDIVLLWKLFLSENGLIGLVVAAILILALRSTLSTIGYGQTNFILLLMLLLFWKDRERWQSGTWLALGICIKPVLAFLLIFALSQRKWRLIASTGVVLVVISLASIITFGPETFVSYLTARPTAKMPDYVYTEVVNQSLLATSLRLTRYDFSNTSPLTQPIFIALAFILIAVTAWLGYNLNSLHDAWALALTLCLALLVYPATLEHYSVLLIIPFLLLWTHRQELVGNVWGVTAFVTLSYALVGYNGGILVFVAIALNWLALAGISMWMLMQRAKQSKTPQVFASSN